MQAHEAQLTLKRLSKLELNWGGGSQHGILEKEVIKELKPHSDWLKELLIYSYSGIEFPKWVGDPSFHWLVHVSIRDCENCTSLPPLGQLPTLKEIFISGMPNVKFIGLEFTGTNQLTFAAFPSLEILRFRDMSSWEAWLTNNKVFDAVFPCLRELEIFHCPKLIEFSPETLPSLEILKLYTRGWKGWSINGEVSVLSRLRELHIGSCSKLIELSPETLPSLEILQFEKMLGRKIWSTNNAVFPCLNELRIENCPELVDVSAEALPFLRVLKIARCGVGVLRSVVLAASSITTLHIESISELTYDVWRGVIEHIGTVEEVSIIECHKIRYLWESEEEASKVLVNIKKLKVFHCFSLASLGEKEEEDNLGGSNLSSLRMLKVSGCNKMERCCCPNSIERLDIGYCSSLTHVSFPASATGGGQKLKSLHIYDWVNLKFMQLGNLIYLTELSIQSCPSIESFPDIQLPVLTHLKIKECKSMHSFSALQMASLTMLQELTITDCPSIDASCHGGFWPPNLCFLELGRLKKPMSEWGPQNCPTSLVKLELSDEPHLSNFRQLSNLFHSSLTELGIYDFDNLESLSMGLQHLTSLQHLTIVRCPKMKYLPKHLLPSLLSLEIIRCPKLRKRCKGRGSHYYPLISRIPFVNI